MNRSRNLVDSYYNRDISLHKPGVIPNSSRIISPITSNHHKYELKQRIWPKKTVESWFANHSSDERRAVFSFLDTLYQDDETNERRRRSPSPRLSRRINTATNYSLQRRASSNNRTSKREVPESLESLRPSSSVQEKGVQTIPLPDVNSKRPLTSIPKPIEIIAPGESSRRYLSQTWRVTNPRDDVEKNVRPDNNTSSFFNYTKKTYPEYFFIHPDWY